MEVLARNLMSHGIRRGGDAGRVGRWSIETGITLPHDVVTRAAREARLAGDYATAERLARSDPEWAIHETGFLLGTVLGAVRRFDEAYDVLSKAAESPPNDEIRARIAYYRIDILAHTWHRPDDAAEVFSQTIAAMRDPAWRDFLTAGWAPALIVAGRHDEALALLEPMAAAAEPRTRLAALRGLAYLLVPAGQTGRVLAMCDELLPVAYELRNEWWYGLSDVISARVLALLMEGRLDDADAVLAMADAAAASTGQDIQALVAVVRGRSALFRGRPTTAAALLGEGSATFTELTYSFRGSWTLRLLAEARALVGDMGAAEIALTEAVGAETPLQYPMDIDERRALAWVTAGGGRLGEARDALLREASAAQAQGFRAYEAMLLHDAARLGAATDVAQRLRELAGLVDGPIVAVYATHAEALAAADAAGLEAASTGFEGLGFALLAAEAAVSASAAFRRAGLTARANAAAVKANQLRTECEGARTPGLSAAADEVELTRREREIAGLAARGLTSRAIADELFLSSRTVDNYLQRVYVKLGIRRRDDLAVALGLEVE
jgi:DNA-binding CsgD family transcriptional regulator